MSTFLAVLTGGGLAALGGLVSGWLTNWLGDKRDQRKYEHERAMAVEARRQERLEQAYIELLGYLSYHAKWALSVRPLLGPVAAPDPLPLEEVRRIEALVEAHGSPVVRGLMDEWRSWAGKLADADQTIGLEERSTQPSKELTDQAMAELKDIPRYRGAMFSSADEIRERVRRELAGDA